MADKAHEWTDEQIKKQEKELHKIYKQAEDELKEKLEDTINQLDEELPKMYEEFKEVYKVDKEQAEEKLKEYKKRYAEALQKKDFYEGQLDTIAKDISDLNKRAISYLNDQTYKVFSRNYNQEIDKVNGMVKTLSFNLLNEDAVRVAYKKTLPLKKLNESKDVAWNRKQIHSQILQSILQGEPITKTAERMERVLGMNEKSAMRISRTLMTSAQNEGRQQSYNDLVDGGIVMKKTWIATADEHTRTSHLELDGEEVEVDEEFSNGLMFPGDMNGDPEEYYNCFIAETKIATDSDIVRSYKHLYDGDLIRVKTSMGVEFSCTPNHPILSDRGWVKASLLNNGDNLLVTFVGDDSVPRRNPNIKHVFPCIDAVHESFDEMTRQRASCMNVNFHGDIPTSNVEIVTKKRFLRENVDVSRYKSADEVSFMLANKSFLSKRTFLKHFISILRSSFSFISRGRKTLSFFFGKLRHSKVHSLRPISGSNITFRKPSENNLTTDSELVCDSLDRLSRVVFTDKIVDVNVYSFHGFVYNLQTDNNYYFVNSISQVERKDNGIMAIAHNCRCTMASFVYGFRNEDGTITPIDFEHQKTEHDRKIEEEKKERGLLEEKKEEEPKNPDNLKTSVTDVIGYPSSPKSQEDAMKEVNPHRDDWMTDPDVNYEDYRCNCQRCAPAYELSRRGYDVEAKKFDGEYSGWMDVFETDGYAKDVENWVSNSAKAHWTGNPYRRDAPADTLHLMGRGPKGATKTIEEAMTRWGEGSRAVMCVEWKAGGGHIVNVENVGGKVVIYDSQVNKSTEDIEEYLKRTIANHTELCRVDHLKVREEMNEKFKSVVKKREHD